MPEYFVFVLLRVVVDSSMTTLACVGLWLWLIPSQVIWSAGPVSYDAVPVSGYSGYTA